MIVATNHLIHENSFLSEVSILPIEDGELVQDSDNAALLSAAQACRSSGLPYLINGANGQAASIFCLPVFCGAELRSIVSFVARANNPGASGVFEIWSPKGLYQDLGLSSGYFGDLERFQNVSSFVRFEKGSGLPGQAWVSGRSIIQDNLKNHPSFLRAAGASADSLQTAIGIPIFSTEFLATAALISSQQSPIANAFEIWIPTADDQFELADCAYSALADALRLTQGHRIPSDGSLCGQVATLQNAVLCEDPAVIFAGRSCPSSATAIAIPTFVDGELSSITSLVL